MNAIPELGLVFETKARAPYKVVFEVCKLSELIEDAEKSMREERQMEEKAKAERKSLTNVKPLAETGKAEEEVKKGD